MNINEPEPENLKAWKNGTERQMKPFRKKITIKLMSIERQQGLARENHRYAPGALAGYEE